MFNGVPAGMMFFLGTISPLANHRRLRDDSQSRSSRCAEPFAAFVAHVLWDLHRDRVIFFGQMKFTPEPIRIVPLVSALGIAPPVILLYRMWRMRLRHGLTGIVVASPLEV